MKVKISIVAFGAFIMIVSLGTPTFLEDVPFSDDNYYITFVGFVLFVVGGWKIIFSKDCYEYPSWIKICPECEMVFDDLGRSESICPNCNVELEPLDGFYDRHPEKRD
jgi:hypothetical protein